MEATLKKLQEQCAKFSPELGKYSEKLQEFYKTAGVASEAAGSETADASKYGDFSTQLSAFQNDAYKLPTQFKEYGQALAELASVFSFGTIPAGKSRAEFVKGVKDSSLVYVNKVLGKSTDDAKPANRAWRESIIAVFASVEGSIEGQQGSATGGMGGLFSQINTGTGLTTGLKKVDDSQKTHKNPALRGGSVVTSKAGGPTHSGSAGESGPIIAGDPVFEKSANNSYTGKFLQGTQHTISGPISTKVYVSRSVGAQFIVDTKINTVVLERCHDCLVHVKAGVIATVELVGCKSCHIQCDVAVPLVQMDKSTGCIIYVKDSDMSDAEKSDKGFSTMQVITSLCDSINIHHTDDSMVHLHEMPVPSVFCSKFDQKSKKWVTEPQVI